MNNDKPNQSGQKSVPIMEPARPSKPASANPAYANVDRLIDLASDQKPAALPAALVGANDSHAKDSSKHSEDKPMWKILLQLKPFLPYLTRLVPLLDLGLIPAQNAGLSNEVRQAVTQTTAKIQAIQDDVSAAVASAVADQALQLKRLEEELTRLGNASEKNAAAQASLAHDLASIHKLVGLSAAGIGVLLVALIVMTAVLLSRAMH